jgi:hypothetical protein
MLSAVRSRLTYANVVATLALVFAMSGGALAATHYLITSTKQISPKVLKELRGKEGAAGVAGSAGSPGAPGKEGVAGKGGVNGNSGANGESVLITELAPGSSECKEGGSKFEVGAGGKPTHACNGAKGKEGSPGKDGEGVTNTPLPKGNTNCEEGGAELKVGSGSATYACTGSPWPAGGTLPPGKTETGTWSFFMSTKGESEPEFERVPISFPIPLPARLLATNCGAGPSAECHVQVIKKGETGTGGCEGGTLKAPSAKPGNLCIYITQLDHESEYNASSFLYQNPEDEAEPSVGTTGALWAMSIKPESEGAGRGTWAVTAEE